MDPPTFLSFGDRQLASPPFPGSEKSPPFSPTGSGSSAAAWGSSPARRGASPAASASSPGPAASASSPGPAASASSPGPAASASSPGRRGSSRHRRLRRPRGSRPNHRVVVASCQKQKAYGPSMARRTSGTVRSPRPSAASTAAVSLECFGTGRLPPNTSPFQSSTLPAESRSGWGVRWSPRMCRTDAPRCTRPEPTTTSECWSGPRRRRPGAELSGIGGGGGGGSAPPRGGCCQSAGTCRYWTTAAMPHMWAAPGGTPRSHPPGQTVRLCASEVT
eukprot:scaffold27544_cov86-Isochrysis_galbana.AAC.3